MGSVLAAVAWADIIIAAALRALRCATVGATACVAVRAALTWIRNRTGGRHL